MHPSDPIARNAAAHRHGGRLVAGCLAWALLLGSPALRAQTAAPPAEARAAAADEARFDLLAFNVKGNTLLSTAEVEAAVYGFLGEARTIADAEGARGALERLYQSRGFLSVVVALPPQNIEDGELTLEVIEARIGSRRITGAQYNLPSRIAQGTPSLAPGSVPDFEQVQAELGRLQAQADLRLTPVVTPGKQPDRIDVELKVEDALALHGAAEINSKQSFNTARGRAEVSLRYDNLFQRGHGLGLTWIVSPRRISESNTRVLSYNAPLGDADPSRLALTLVSSDSQTPSSLGGNTVVRGENLGARWRLPLRSASPEFSHGWSLGADLKHSRDRSEAAPGLPSSSTELRYSVYTLGYDAFRSEEGGQIDSFDVSLATGISGLNERLVSCPGRNEPVSQFACKQQGARPGFQVLKLNASHRRPFFGGTSLQLRAQAQLSADTLVSGERFGAGGVDSVRGYYEYEQVGEQGLVLGGELVSPPLWKLGAANLSALGFLEGAALKVNEPLAAEQGDIRMASIGGGLRLVGGGLRVALDIALPLRQTLKADSSGALVPASGKATRNERRIDLSIRHSF